MMSRSTNYKDAGIQEVDAVWRTLKPLGRFQMFQFFLTVIDIVPSCFAILGAVVTGYIPDFECLPKSENISGSNDDDNLTYVPNQCSVNVHETYKNTSVFVEEQPCDRFVFSSEYSYVSEWKLVCSRSNIAALAQSLAIAGQGIGALVMSQLADLYGRKTIHILSHIGIMFAAGIMAASPNIYVLLVLRLVAGAFQQGLMCTSRILAVEMFPREYRHHTAPIGSAFWSLGVMVLSLFGYIFRDINWRYLQLGLAAVSIYSVVEWWLMEESVRWLLCNGKVKEANRILRKAARWNNVDYYAVEMALNEHVHMDTEDAKPMKDLAEGPPKDEAVGKKYTMIDILKNPALRVNTLILWYSWIVVTASYFGLTLVSSHLAGDRHVNFFISGVIEIPSLVATLFMLTKIGRKKTMVMWYGLAAVSLVVSTVAFTAFEKSDVTDIVATTFSMIGKSSIVGAFAVIYLYTPEIYPTNYRNSGLGVGSSVGRIGGILAPFASNLALIALWIPGAIFAAMCVLVVLLALKLPESSVYELPTTIAECDTWVKHDADTTFEQENEDDIS